MKLINKVKELHMNARKAQDKELLSTYTLLISRADKDRLNYKAKSVDVCWDLLNERGVFMDDIVDCVVYLQKKYSPDIEDFDIKEIVNSVVRKREVQNTIITGIGIDMAVEQGIFPQEHAQHLIGTDEGLYGPDETLAIGITNLYGSIALTNFGYIDKEKPGIVGKLDSLISEGQCHTFLDDIVGAIAASAASKFAHT